MPVKQVVSIVPMYIGSQFRHPILQPLRQVQQQSERPSLFSSSRNPYRPTVESEGYGDNKLTAVGKAFSSLLFDSICESLEHALGPDVVQILVSKGLLDNSNNPEKFEGQLRSIFFDGAKVLERLIIKDLYRKLGIPYNSDTGFDFEKSIETAKETCLSLADQVMSE